jgi:hypothetical protein
MATVIDKHSVIPPTEQPAWKALEHDSSTNTLIGLCRKFKETP